MSPRHRIVLPLAAGLAAAGGIAALALLIALPSRWKSDTIPPPGLETALTEFDAGRSEQGLAELARVRRRWTHPLWNRRVEFLAAYWSARLQLLQPALLHLERLGPLEPFLSADQPGFPLAPQAAALEGSLLLRLNRAPEAARILDPLTRRFERFAPGEDALETWALAASAAGQRPTVLTRLDELRGARRLSAPERFQLLSGRIRLEGGDAPGAAAIFKSVFCRFPQGSAAARALELLQALPAPVKGWSRSDLPMLLQRASLLREAGDTRGAADTWAFAREQMSGGRDDPEINISRVRTRVKQGGHPVPEEKIAPRYYRSLDLLMEAIRHTNRAYIFDNSGHQQERTWLAEITDGRTLEMKTDQVPAWFKRAVLDKISPPPSAK